MGRIVKGEKERKVDGGGRGGMMEGWKRREEDGEEKEESARGDEGCNI